MMKRITLAFNEEDQNVQKKNIKTCGIKLNNLLSGPLQKVGYRPLEKMDPIQKFNV